MRLLVALAIVVFAVALPGTAHAGVMCGHRGCRALARYASAHPAMKQTITLYDENSGANPAIFHDLERALVWQADQLHSLWGTPEIRFGTGGWPLILVSDTSTAGQRTDQGCEAFWHQACQGVHLYNGYKPYATVTVGHDPWTVIASHELMEMLADPILGPDRGGREVCDRVENHEYTYPTGGRKGVVALSDFVTPAYFDGGAGPYDVMGVLHAAVAG